MAAVCRNASIMSPLTTIANCELAIVIVKLADWLKLDDILKTFEKNGCLDAFEKLQEHENP